MLAPSEAALSAMARPIPREAPVMKRVLPFNDIDVKPPQPSIRQRCLRVSYASGAFRDAALKAARLDRDIFGEEAGQDGTAGAVSGAKRSERLFGQHAAAGHI